MIGNFKNGRWTFRMCHEQRIRVVLPGPLDISDIKPFMVGQ